MSFANNEDAKLFTQLSEQQEEIVSGGFSSFNRFGGGGDLGLSVTQFFQGASALNTFSQSGPQGSIAGGSSIEELIRTSGVNVVR